MKSSGFDGMKRKITVAAVLTGAILCILTFLFVRDVKQQLWEQSVNTITEATRQGCNTLKVQLQEELEDLGTVRQYVETLSRSQEQELCHVLDEYERVDDGISLYLSDGTSFPNGIQTDEEAVKLLGESDSASGFINPHISSVSGVNVFDLYVRVTLKDGTAGYLIKEYEIDTIVDSFSLSFYNDAGFSYVVNTSGDVLIRPPHPNSNKTVKNLFDMLPESENAAQELHQFKESLRDSRTGWAVFSYQGEPTVFCYTPLKLESGWHLISIIPEKVVNEQTNQILLRTLGLIGSIILGIALLVICYLWDANKTNRKLRNQADYIGHLYSAIPEGIAVMSVEHPYHLFLLNKEGIRLLDYRENGVEGKTLQDFVHTEDYEKISKIFREVVSEGKKAVFENRVLKGNGEFLWTAGVVEKTLDENGKPVLIATFHDITNEKMEEEALEREKLMERVTLVGAISNAYPVIISVNLSRDTLKFVYVKPGVMAGVGYQESYSEIYQEFLQMVHPDNQEEFRQRMAPDRVREALEYKSEVFVEARQLLNDDRYHWISTQIIHVDNPYSEEKLAILISRRIDEQRYEEEQQRQALQSALDAATSASQAKSQFLSNMSHDIRTPMNAIVGMTAIAAAHLDERERVMECLQKITLSSRHLLSLINDVLDMSKIESGKLSIKEEPFNFAELAAEVLELVRPQADAGQLEVDVRMSVLKNENVIGDPLRIRQVCINVLSNAVKYTPSGGQIQIEVRQEESSRRGYQKYVFRCEDTGIGMSPEFLEHLFKPFERAQDSTSSKITGTGLGMAITKNLVDLMNGDIQVESQPGEGSVFTVTLPLKLQTAPQVEVPAEWVGVHSLIVDDDRQTCENAAELLENMGLRAQFVTEGRKAVECAVQAQETDDPYELMIIDWKMPDMNGVEVARRVRATIGPEIPLIVLSAYDWSEIESEAREAGVTAFLSKPFYRSKICYLLSELSGEKEYVNPVEYTYNPEDFAGKRVLLAEDNEINREIARTLITEMGVTCIDEACDGAEAVKMVARSGEGYYDLILMDIQMPRLDGYEAARAIRNLERRDVLTLPIVAMTANAFEEDVQEAMRAGMNAHFAKPVDTNVLEQLLYKYLVETGSENAGAPK